MTHLLRRLLASAVVLAFAVPAFAAEPEKAPAKGPSDTDVGVLGHFMTADPVLAMFYDRYQSVDGPTVGLFYTKRRANGFRITVDGTYTPIAPKDGPWLAKGKDIPSSEFTEFRQGSTRGFAVASAHVFLGHDFGGDNTFGFYMGGGIGLDFLLGKITSYDTTGPNFDQNAGTTPQDKLKGVPGVIPTLCFKAGPTVKLGTKGVLEIDAGLEDGLFVGAQLGMRL